jgi:hypothetical protein
MDDQWPPDMLIRAEKILEKIRDRSRHISVDRLILDISRIVNGLPDFCLFVRQRKFFKSNDDEPDSREYLLLYYMSFRVVDGQLERFNSRDECSSTYDDLTHTRVLEEDDLVVCCSASEYSEYEEELEAIADIMAVMYHSNIYDEILDNSARKFRRELSRENPTYSIPDMLDYLVANHKEVEGLALLEVYRTVDRKIDKVETQLFKGNRADFHVKNLHGAINYAARTQKPSDGYFENERSAIVNFIVVPLVENIARPSAPERAHKFILLFRCEDEVEQFLVKFAQVGAQYSEEADVARSQINLLHELHVAHRAHVNSIRAGELNEYDHRNDSLRINLSECLRNLYDCTSAHSVTVRLFDPLSKTLRLLVEQAISTGRYSQQFSGDIKISCPDSVNARCFRECGPNERRYEPLLAKPEDTTRHHSSNAVVVLNPRGSRSELCFPLWGDGVPIGTFNLESPIPRAFDRDLDFLESLARSIGEIVFASLSTVPPDAVSQLATINELAHGISIDRSDLDPEIIKSLPVTISRTMEEISYFLFRLRDPKKTSPVRGEPLREIIVSSLNDAMGPFVREEFDFTASVLIEDKVNVGHEAQIIRSILDGVFSNSRKHSSMAHDRFVFEIVEREHVPSIFRIEYEAKKHLVDCATLRSFGLVPVVKGGQNRFGAFLLGFRIRAAGGRLSVERPPIDARGFAPLKFVVEIPVEKNEIIKRTYS